MVQPLFFCLFFCFSLTKPLEMVSNTPTQFLIDFVTELELRSILIIKDEEDGSPVLLLNLLVKHINSLNKMVAVVNYDSR